MIWKKYGVENEGETEIRSVTETRNIMMLADREISEGMSFSYFFGIQTSGEGSPT